MTDSIECLAIDPQEEYVAFGDFDGIIRVCNIDDPSKVMVIPAHDTHVHSILFDPKSNRLISCGRDGQLKSCIYDSRFSKYSRMVSEVASSNLMVVGENRVAGFELGRSGNWRVYMLDTNHLEKIAWETPFSGPGVPQLPSASGRTSRYLATYVNGEKSLDKWRKPEAYLLDAKTGTVVHRWLLEENLNSIALSDRASMVAAANSQNKVLLFDTESGKKTHEFSYSLSKEHFDVKPDVCFSPNGRLLAHAIKDKIYLIDVITKNTIKTLEGHARGIATLCFSNDSSHVACAGLVGKNIRIWNVETGQQTAELTGHLQPILNIQFLSANRLLSNDRNGFVVWDLTSQQQFFYHSVGKFPHDLFEGAKHIRENTAGYRDLVHCAKAVILPKEDWLALTSDPGNPQFLKLDVSDVWPKR